jgi:hypothetical protein
MSLFGEVFGGLGESLGIGSLFGSVPEPTASDLGYAARRQIQSAAAGYWLKAPQQAEDFAMMNTVPVNDAGALLRAAYWVAVAARVTQSRSLASTAFKHWSGAVAFLSIPGAGSVARGSVSRILQGAAQDIQAGAPNSSAALTIVGILRTIGLPAAVTQKQADNPVLPQLPSVPGSDAISELTGAMKTAGYAVGVAVLVVGLGGMYYWWTTSSSSSSSTKKDD